ncbi:MAG: cellulase family glycosylhydrolase [Bacteroidaceae bacterium]|nr:cellulase family glycosylhydrolase [Bacteroidaceae bacterium]
MKKLLTILSVSIVLMAALQPNANAQNGFEIKRGVNVSHWLSQSQARGQARANHIKEQDMIRIRELGFDHIRLPIDEVQFWDEQGNRLDEAWQLLTNAVEWCCKHNLRVIVDLHTLRSHSFVLQEGQKNTLYEDPAELQKLIEMWTQLSAVLKRFPVSMVAYEFMNEPVADDPEQWNQVVEKVHAALRKLEPERKLVIGSNRWQSVGTFKDLRIPKGDKNIILSFHYYNPMFVTHYRASWTDVGRFTGTVTYPGQLISQAEYEQATPQIQKIIRDNEGLTVWNRERIKNDMADAIKLAQDLGLQLFCGEWGAYQRTPRDLAYAWMTDMISIFNECNIAWTLWCYDADFGFWDQRTQDFKDKGMFDILMK